MRNKGGMPIVGVSNADLHAGPVYVTQAKQGKQTVLKACESDQGDRLLPEDLDDASYQLYTNYVTECQLTDVRVQGVNAGRPADTVMTNRRLVTPENLGTLYEVLARLTPEQAPAYRQMVTTLNQSSATPGDKAVALLDAALNYLKTGG